MQAKASEANSNVSVSLLTDCFGYLTNWHVSGSLCHSPFEPAMPLAIRSLDTGLFYDHGQWTADPKLAQDFPSFESAKELALKENIRNADVVTIHINGRVSGGVPIRISN